MKKVQLGSFVLLSCASLAAIAFLFWSVGGHRRDERTVRAEELAVYRSLLSDWIQSGHRQINLVSIPMPLDVAECESGISRGDSRDIGKLVSSDIAQLKTDRIQLLDIETSIDPSRRDEVTRNVKRGAPMSGGILGQIGDGSVLTFSTVLFDSSHQRAIAGYRYWCGGDCGHGKTLLLERRGDEWAVSKFCSRFVM